MNIYNNVYEKEIAHSTVYYVDRGVRMHYKPTSILMQQVFYAFVRLTETFM